MTIDSEGMLWIANWDGWQVTRWNPATGEKIVAIKLPVAK
jgi:sugar lactone lactonase YvrE